MDNEETVTEAETPVETAPEKEESRADQLRLLEALLFASTAPLDEKQIKQRMPAGADIPSLIAELDAQYNGRGVNIIKVAGGWTLRTAPDLAPRLKLTQKVTRKLSRAAIETLAIVAYHQPVTRAEVEDIRGVVVSGGTLDLLMEIGWITAKGRRETVGRPVTWGTTDEFLMHFGLASIGDLPGVEELRSSGLIGPRPDFALKEVGHLAELPTTEAAVEALAAKEDAAEAEAEAEAAAEELGRDDAEDEDDERDEDDEDDEDEDADDEDGDDDADEDEDGDEEDEDEHASSGKNDGQ